MKLLEQKLEAQFAAQRAEIKRLKENYGSHALSDVTVAQLYGGMRGVTAVACDTSEVDPQRGLIIRGRPVKELTGKAAEEVFWLLLTGELPTGELPTNSEAGWLHSELARRRTRFLPTLEEFVQQDNPGFNPVARLCMAFQYMQARSKFLTLSSDLPRLEQWRPLLDDVLDIFSIIPEAVATLTKSEQSPFHWQEWAVRLGWAITAGGDKLRPYVVSTSAPIEPLDPESQTLDPLMRHYVLVHCDHEGSNACALACRTAASTLADPYLALTAGWRALAGPIHGLASQVCIELIDEILATLGEDATDEQLAAFVQQRLDRGHVIPGFGHAVLRAMDPRYELLHAFAKTHFPGDPAFRIADGLLRVVPPLLMATGKVANPWPNVDGISGVVMQHYGLTDYRWLTVLFAACMSLGLLAQMVVSRGLGEPIVHPKAVTPELLRRMVEDR